MIFNLMNCYRDDCNVFGRVLGTQSIQYVLTAIIIVTICFNKDL